MAISNFLKAYSHENTPTYNNIGKDYANTLKRMMFAYRIAFPHSFGANQNLFGSETAMTGNDGVGYELGTKFKTTTSGTINGVRMYAGQNEGGTHTVRIWRVSDQTLMGDTYYWNFTPGTPGWKEFSIPGVHINANTEYIVSISTSSDHYFAARQYFFDVGQSDGNLYADLACWISW